MNQPNFSNFDSHIPGTRGIVVTGQSSTGSKPFNPPRSRESAANAKIYALLVGINAYVGPPGILPLGGCLEDVKMMEDYLRKQYGSSEDRVSGSIGGEDPVIEAIDDELPIVVDGSLHLCVLRDSQATYKNIIRAFQEHLCQATGNDSVWFHFSGHGAWQETADEFAAALGKNTDECLVCYQPKDTIESVFLADKELAKLLSEVYDAHPTPGGQHPHIMVSLDACQSGGGTRSQSGGRSTRFEK